MRRRNWETLLLSVNVPNSLCESVWAHLAIYGAAICLAAGKLWAIDLWPFKAHLSIMEELLLPSNNSWKQLIKYTLLDNLIRCFLSCTHTKTVSERKGEKERQPHRDRGNSLLLYYCWKALLKITTETIKSQWLYCCISSSLTALPVTHYRGLAFCTPSCRAITRQSVGSHMS